MKNKFVMGVDIGGTKIMSGVMSSAGEVVGKPFTVPTGGLQAREKIIERIFLAVEKAATQAGLPLALWSATINCIRLSNNSVKLAGVAFWYCPSPIFLKRSRPGGKGSLKILR